MLLFSLCKCYVHLNQIIFDEKFAWDNGKTFLLYSTYELIDFSSGEQEFSCSCGVGVAVSSGGG